MTTNTARTLLDLPNLRVVQSARRILISSGGALVVVDPAELPALIAALVVANDAYGDAL